MIITKPLDFNSYLDLWWMNWWWRQENRPEEYKKCREEKHPLKEIQNSIRWTNNDVWCEECKIRYKYDCWD